jgi:23S rRNA (cytidine1920-2'-O)/16S rRNA (cytidine1409-2'-O)-methyltransferase
VPRNRRTLRDEVRRQRPEANADELIAAGLVLVRGRPATDPKFQIARGTAVIVLRQKVLRGTTKLQSALRHFGVPVAGRVALDLGAATGGFTRALLNAGAVRVYAADAGFG